MIRHLIAPLAAAAALGAPALAEAAQPRHLVGAMHEHSGYSDGWPGSRPVDYFASARDKHDLEFLGSGEHSTNADVPFVFNEECYEEPDVRLPQCLIADPVNPADSFRKWEATKEQADAATDPAKDFTAFQGFEWSSERQGHINVYFSNEDTSPERDGGDLDMDLFYDWLIRPSSQGGGSDGLAVFNHPGFKSICGQLGCEETTDPSFNWEDFAYEPKADAQMVGIEVFNGSSDYGSASGRNAPPEGWYARALDRGWHVGAVGAEDKGHDRTDDWGAPKHAKTVILSPENSRPALKEAMLRRRFYAVLDNSLRLEFAVGGAPMGSRLRRPAGEGLEIVAKASGGDPVTLELVTGGGKVVASDDDGELSVTRPTAAAERWYYVRARRGSKNVGYSSPVWVDATTPAARGEWLAGDLHLHSCYSHDAYCPQTTPPISRSRSPTTSPRTERISTR
jgi:hypothetical protein